MHAVAGVDEPLPPTNRLLSGLEGEFQAKDGDAQPDQEDSSAEGGGEAKEGEEKADDAGDETEDAEEEEEPKPVIELKTASHDPRFPSTNQVLHHQPTGAVATSTLRSHVSHFLARDLIQLTRSWARI